MEISNAEASANTKINNVNSEAKEKSDADAEVAAQKIINSAEKMAVQVALKETPEVALEEPPEAILNANVLNQSNMQQTLGSTGGAHSKKNNRITKRRVG